MDERELRIFLIVFAAILIGAFVFVGFAISRDIDRKRECEAKGGVYSHPLRREAICFKRESLIQ